MRRWTRVLRLYSLRPSWKSISCETPTSTGANNASATTKHADRCTTRNCLGSWFCSSIAFPCHMGTVQNHSIFGSYHTFFSLGLLAIPLRWMTTCRHRCSSIAFARGVKPLRTRRSIPIGCTQLLCTSEQQWPQVNHHLSHLSNS